MSSAGSIPHFAPADQPVNVRQIAQRLFPAYTIDDGSVHLAGCSLEDRLFVRLTFDRDGSPLDVYVDEKGEAVGEDMQRRLGMAQTRRIHLPPEFVQPQVEHLVQSATQLSRQNWPDTSIKQPVATALVWCKYVTGKIRFTLGEHAVDLPFEGWTRLLRPPPFICPYSGESTFHLAATEDGRIAAASQIACCEETGRRVLAEDLTACSATGRRVLSELTRTCPITGQPVFHRALAPCGTCGERVSPAVLKQDQCSACRCPSPVGNEDPRLKRLLERHPDLSRWRKWRISETASVYVLFAAGWFHRLLVVADKDSLDLKRVTTASRFATAWSRRDPA